MWVKNCLVIFVILAGSAGVCLSQVPAANKQPPSRGTANFLTSSPAYAEVLLRRTELDAELEALLLDYTEDFPKVKEIRQTLTYLKRESDRLATVKPAEASKLTLALGKLIVRKVELETDLWGLMKTYNEAHPEVKRAKRKVEIYEAAIKEILG